MKVINRTAYNSDDIVAILDRCFQLLGVTARPNHLRITYRYFTTMVGSPEHQVALSIPNFFKDRSPLEMVVAAEDCMPRESKLEVARVALMWISLSFLKQQGKQRTNVIRNALGLPTVQPIGGFGYQPFLFSEPSPIFEELARMPVRRKVAARQSTKDRLKEMLDHRDGAVSKIDSDVADLQRNMQYLLQERAAAEESFNRKIARLTDKVNSLLQNRAKIEERYNQRIAKITGKSS